ncbi:MAG: biopolymer transporter ExbD [Bacteroidales bacterium]|nr:biopolymer transporter ExbD [Bacteroidales bacterium]
MQGRFIKGNKRLKSIQVLSTASLPDIIFMLLFFFMVTTTFKTNKLLLKFKEPYASETVKIKKKRLVREIIVGYSDKAETSIQINNEIIKLTQLSEYINKIKNEAELSPDNELIFSLKIDKNIKMETVNALTKELRKANALLINYSTLKTNK